MFTRIKVEYTEEMSELASQHAIPHVVLPSPGEPYTSWSTFQFSTEQEKRAFDRLCRANEVLVDGTQIVNQVIDDVIGGKSPANIIERMVTRKMTAGTAKAYDKAGMKYRCKNCGGGIPKYSGRYPSECPNCGGDLQEVAG